MTIIKNNVVVLIIYKGMGIYRKGDWMGINSWKIRKIIKNVKMRGRKRSYPCVSSHG